MQHQQLNDTSVDQGRQPDYHSQYPAGGTQGQQGYPQPIVSTQSYNVQPYQPVQQNQPPYVDQNKIYPQPGPYPVTYPQVGINIHSLPKTADGLAYSSQIQCPYCNRAIATLMNKKIGPKVWIIFIILLFVFWPLCWLPFVIDDCRDRVHYCPNCGHEVGRKSRCC